MVTHWEREILPLWGAVRPDCWCRVVIFTTSLRDKQAVNRNLRPPFLFFRNAGMKCGAASPRRHCLNFCLARQLKKEILSLFPTLTWTSAGWHFWKGFWKKRKERKMHHKDSSLPDWISELAEQQSKTRLSVTQVMFLLRELRMLWLICLKKGRRDKKYWIWIGHYFFPLPLSVKLQSPWRWRLQVKLHEQQFIYFFIMWVTVEKSNDNRGHQLGLLRVYFLCGLLKKSNSLLHIKWNKTNPQLQFPPSMTISKHCNFYSS